MSMRESRFSIRATSFGSVSPAMEQTVTFVCVRRPDGLARKPQLRRAQMPPDKGRVDPDRLGERILRALDGVFALRRGGAAPRPALGLEAERLGQPGKDHHAVPMRQLVRRGLGRVRLLTHRAPDRAALRLRI